MNHKQQHITYIRNTETSHLRVAIKIVTSGEEDTHICVTSATYEPPHIEKSLLNDAYVVYIHWTGHPET